MSCHAEVSQRSRLGIPVRSAKTAELRPGDLLFNGTFNCICHAKEIWRRESKSATAKRISDFPQAVVASGGVIVTVDEEHIAGIESVAAALRQAGMQVHQVMPNIGTITGEVPSGAAQSLSSVKGVASIEPDEGMRAI